MNKTHLLLATLCLIFFSHGVYAGKLYKWADENGEISFSDKVQPKDSRRERGRTISIKDAAKTPEQIQLLKRIEALQIIKKQLLTQQKAAAKFERSGKTIPHKNMANIQAAQEQYDKNQLEIADYELQKQQLTDLLASDKKRFKSLKSTSTQPEINTETVPSLMLGEINCDTSNCEEFWSKAQQFVTDNGSQITFLSDTLLLTETPNLGKDRGLPLTKINNEEQTTIVLDIRCANSKSGKRTCKNEQTIKLFGQFNLMNP